MDFEFRRSSKASDITSYVSSTFELTYRGRTCSLFEAELDEKRAPRDDFSDDCDCSCTDVMLKDGKTYIVVGRNEGLVYKRVIKNAERNSLILMSNNPIYAPYELAYEDVAELWQYYAHLSFSDDFSQVGSRVEDRIIDIQKNIEEIKESIQN